MQYVGKKYKDIDIEYIENSIYNETNNIYSLYLAREKFVEDDTILLESDLIFDEKILQKVLNNKNPNLAVVDKYQSRMDGTAVTFDKEYNIDGFFDKHSFSFADAHKYYKTVNIYKFSKEFSKNKYIPFLKGYLKAMGRNEYYETVLKILTFLPGDDLKVLPLSGEKWYEIDDIQDKKNAEIIFAKTAKEKLKLIQGRYGWYWRFPHLKDFCYLVTPYFPNQKMLDEMQKYFVDLLTQYPSGQRTQNVLAGKMFKVEEENIVVGNGAAEIIRALWSAIDGTFGMCLPTFNEYPESIGYDRVIQHIPENADFSYGKEEIIELSEKCDTVILINPDNPSGNFIPKTDLIEIAETLLESGKKFIVDESFVDFSTQWEAESMITQEILDQFPNLLVIKSISKSYGVPGLRLGVVAGSDTETLQAIQKKLTIWNINSFGEFFLQIIGKYKKDFTEWCRLFANERDRFFGRLQEIPFLRPIYSQANYFMVEVTDTFSATELAELLLEKYEIYIKDLTGKIAFEDKQYIRLAVRDYNDNEFLIAKLQELWKS